MAVTLIRMQILFVIGVAIKLEALILFDDCRWNYTLKNERGSTEYNVEYTNVGNDCDSLHKKVPTHKMLRGPVNSVHATVERTTDPVIQRINISWYLERDIPEYLLKIKLLRQETRFYVSPEDTICIYVRVKQAQAQIQFQQTYHLTFDCIQVKTGTIGSAVEIVLRKRAFGRHTECDVTNKNQDRSCFRTKPQLYNFDVEAHCCPLEMPTLRVVQAHFHDFCTWNVSASSLGLSSAAYMIRGSNGTLVDEGSMTENKMADLFVGRIKGNSPDIYTISVSLRCSFDSDSRQEDYNCWNVKKEIDATMCKKVSPRSEPQKGTTTKDGFCFSSTEEILPLECVTVIVLGCVFVVILSTVCVFLYLRGYLPYCQPSTNVPSNIATRNVTIDATQNETVRFLINNTLVKDQEPEDQLPNVTVGDNIESADEHVHR